MCCLLKIILQIWFDLYVCAIIENVTQIYLLMWVGFTDIQSNLKIKKDMRWWKTVLYAEIKQVKQPKAYLKNISTIFSHPTIITFACNVSLSPWSYFVSIPHLNLFTGLLHTSSKNSNTNILAQLNDINLSSVTFMKSCLCHVAACFHYFCLFNSKCTFYQECKPQIIILLLFPQEC